MAWQNAYASMLVENDSMPTERPNCNAHHCFARGGSRTLPDCRSPEPLLAIVEEIKLLIERAKKKFNAYYQQLPGDVGALLVFIFE